MGALTTDFDGREPAESFLLVLDQFAALRDYSGANVGGYRVFKRHREPQRLALQMSSTIATLARARMRLTGFLSVLFVGALGLAVLAGPSNCACSGTTAEEAALARLDYVPNVALMTRREAVPLDAELPTLSAASLIEPEAAAIGVSPITTSSLEASRDVPTGEVATLHGEDVAPPAARRLPATIEELTDAKPETIRLAAASNVETDAVPTLPLVEVASPRVPDAVADEAERAAAGTHAPRRRVTRAYRGPAKQIVRARKPNGEPAPKSPKWAQQMFVTPWQTKAFSYTQ